MPQKNIQNTIFLSHSHLDEAVAEVIHNWIDKTFNRLIVVFRSSDTGKSIKIGDDIKNKIKRALKSSIASISLLSHSSVNRPWMNIEFGASWILDINIIPLCLPGFGPEHLPFHIAGAKICRLDSKDNCIELLDNLLEKVKLKYPSYNIYPEDKIRRGEALFESIKELSDSSQAPLILEKEPPPKRRTVWVFGSYSELNGTEKSVAESIVKGVPPGLVDKGVRVVMGDSDMLRDFAGNFVDSAIAKKSAIPNPIILRGRIRQRNLKYLFMDAINVIPDLGILIGKR